MLLFRTPSPEPFNLKAPFSCRGPVVLGVGASFLGWLRLRLRLWLLLLVWFLVLTFCSGCWCRSYCVHLSLGGCGDGVGVVVVVAALEPITDMP